MPTLTAGSEECAASVNINGMSVTDTVGQPAGIWLRVFTGGQDETNQEPDILRHSAAQGYRIERRYELRDRSASKGEQQAKLDEMLADMREGAIKVLVCWHSDRLERRGPECMFRLLAQVKDAGGRIESTKEPVLGTADLSGEALTALNSVIAHQYSVHLGEQVKIGLDATKENNAVYTCLPWGYAKPTGPRRNKVTSPTDECREYWPQVLQRCIAGDSCRTIAVWLDSEGVKPTNGGKWDEGVVRRLILNLVYCGRRLGWGNGAPLLKDEAVVTVDLWVRANEALRNRPKRGPKSTRVNPVNPMLAKLKCARCGSPMYRIHAGSRDRESYYYRCAGSGPQRKGCGNMIPLERLEHLVVVRFLAWNDKPHQIKEWLEGESWDAEIADIRQKIRELDPESDEDEAQREVLKEQLSDYRSRKTIPGHWGERDILDPNGKVVTIGMHFFDLDKEGRREYLKTRDIRAEKTACCGGIRVVIDGREDVAHKESCADYSAGI